MTPGPVLCSTHPGKLTARGITAKIWREAVYVNPFNFNATDFIRIALCDDEAHQREYLAASVREWAETKQISLHLNSYDSAEQFLMARELPYDILLLDTRLSKLTP